MTTTTYTSATAAPFAESFVTIPYPSGEALVSRVWSTMKRFVELQLTEDRVVAEDDVWVPSWVVPVVRRVRELESLPRNWDSYGGRPLQRRHRDAALRFLGLVLTDDLLAPEIVPLADGGVQLEWRLSDAEIDFISDDEAVLPTLLVTRDGATEEFHGWDAAHYFLESLTPELRRPETAAGWQ